MKNKIRRLARPAFPIVMILLTVIFITGVGFSVAASTETGSATKVRRSHLERTEARINDLQNALKITKDQQELWNSLTQVMRDNAKTMDDLIKARIEKSKAMNAVEDLKSYNQISEAQLEGMKKFMPAFEALYNSMSDDQKKNADSLFKMGRQGKQRRK